MHLTISRQVIADAGPNGVVCQNNSFTVTGATSQYQSSLSWTHNGTGSLTNINSLSPVYTPGAGETGVVTLTLTAAPISPCAGVIDNMQIQVNEAAMANSGGNFTICEGNSYTISASTASGYASLAWSTSGSGSFNNAAALHPIYTPSLTDITNGSVILTLTANPFTSCSASSSPMTLTITRQVVGDAGINATICGNSTFTPLTASANYYNSVLWTTTGTGIIANANTMSPVYTPGAGETGTINLILTATANSPCVNVTDQMQLTINEAASANAGGNATICEGSSHTLLASVASGYASLSWTTTGSGV
jgi:hypothetical protein